jgi:chemotaxis signal transduction protein
MISAYPVTGSSTSAAVAASPMVGFALAGERYAFRIERIREMIAPGSVTLIPEVPADVAGVSNLRGTVIPVVNVGSRGMGCVDPVLDWSMLNAVYAVIVSQPHAPSAVSRPWSLLP